MRTKIKGLKALILGAGVLMASQARAGEYRILYLIDPKDRDSTAFFEQEGLRIHKAEELIDDERPPLSQKHSRIQSKILGEQKILSLKLQEFLGSEFDPDDDQAISEFVKTRQEIVDLIFKAPTEKDYYSRLYMVNQYWLDHQDEAERFSSLDRAMREEWLRREENRKQIREIIIGGSALLGAAAGSYISFKTSQKVLPIASDEKTLGLILRWLGRTPILLIGAGVGAAAGAYIGFLGSDYLLYRQFEFLDPIDGDEDLRDLLDLLEDLRR